jgi:hypothetical protein
LIFLLSYRFVQATISVSLLVWVLIVNLFGHRVLFLLSPFSIRHCDRLSHLKSTKPFSIPCLLLFGSRLSWQCELLASLPLATKPLLLMALVSYVSVTSVGAICTYDAISHAHIWQKVY